MSGWLARLPSLPRLTAPVHFSACRLCRCEPEPFRGTIAVKERFASLFPDKKSRLVIERIADGGDGKGGFAWHREAAGKEGEIGLRGITYLEVNSAGTISKAVECAEPMTKPGKITADLFAAVVKDLPKNPNGLTYEPRAPDGCGDLVSYIWREAYPAGADPSVAMEYFDDSIVYEDCNYDAPFVGKQEVGEMVEEYGELAIYLCSWSLCMYRLIPAVYFRWILLPFVDRSSPKPIQTWAASSGSSRTRPRARTRAASRGASKSRARRPPTA